MINNASANYTVEMIDTMTAQYLAAPVRATVDAIALDFEKSPRSVISKLSALGIYQKAEVNVTKTGAPVIRKEEYVAQIQTALGQEFASLDKMTKTDLERLVKVLAVS